MATNGKSARGSTRESAQTNGCGSTLRFLPYSTALSL
ncbi:hypothetical protein V2J09_016310 [Rumex salicifolius]